MQPRKSRFFRSFICIILCAVMLFASAARIFAAPVSRTPWDRWYTDAVKLFGRDDRAKRTKGGASRAMLAVISARVGDVDVSPYTERVFDDVPAGKWYSTAVCWAARTGVVRGLTDRLFAPESGLTEDAFYTALTRFYALYGKGEDLLWRGSAYADLASLVSWAKDVSSYMTSSSPGPGGSGENALRSELGAKIASFINSYQPGAGDDRTLSLSLSGVCEKLEAGSQLKLAVSTLPAESAESVVWSVDDPSVLLVGPDGTAVGVREGYATLTAASADGACAASCVVAVTPRPARDPDPNGRKIDPDKPMIAVTYDDGPCKYTGTILDILEQYGAVATFFEQGKSLAYWPDEVNRALAMGCEVGSHSWDHPKFKTMTEAQIADQLERTNLKFIEITGKAPTLMRPPYGGRNETVDAVCKRYGLAEIIWSIDTLDWQVKNADKICKTIREEAYDGAVILVHSTHDFTVEASRTFIPELIAAGYQLVTVSELAAARGITLEPGRKYSGFAKK